MNQKLNLGKRRKRGPLKKDLANERLLSIFEKHIRYEKRFSDYHIMLQLDRARVLLEKYGLKHMTVEEAHHVEEALEENGYKNSNIKKSPLADSGSL